MAKIYDTDIDPSAIDVDWGGDPREPYEGKPLSGRVVQKFIKDNITDIYNNVDGRYLDPNDPDYEEKMANAINSRLDNIEEHSDAIDESIGDLQNDVSDLDNRLDNAENRLDNAENRLDGIDGPNGSIQTLSTRVTTVENAIGDNNSGLTKKVNDVESDVEDIQDTLNQMPVETLIEIAETFDPEQLEADLNSKAGYFYNNAATNEVWVFANEESCEEYLHGDPPDPSLLLGSFAAPSDFEAIVTILGLDGATTKYIQYGTKGQRVRATFEIIRRSTSTPELEAVVATVIIKNDQGITLFEKSQNVAAGGTIDMGVDDYLIEGTNFITVRVRGTETGTVGSASYSIVALNLTLSDTFNISRVVTDNILRIPWVVNGSGAKYIAWYIDGVEYEVESIGVESTITGTKNIPVSNLSPGKHTIQYYVYILLGNSDKFYSDVLYRDFIIDTENISDSQLPTSYIAILSAFSAPANVTSSSVIIAGTGTQADPIILNGVIQYENTKILYAVYYKDQAASKDFIITFDEISSTYSVSSGNDRVYNYLIKPYNNGIIPMTFECGSSTIYFNVSVAESEYDIHPVTNNLAFVFSGGDESNTSATRDLWHYTNSNGQTFNGILTGFNWNEHSGWVDGRLIIPNGASFITDYKPFYRTSGNSINTTGLTLEIEFQTDRVLDENTPILDLRDYNERGLFITTSEVIYNSSNGATLSTKYKPEEDMRISIVINPETGSEYQKKLMIYVDGVLSGVTEYDAGDYFGSDVVFSIIGTNNAIVQLKQMMCYERALSSNEILNNFILYRDNTEELIDTYERNNIYTDSSMTNISMEKLAEKTPVIIITGTERNDVNDPLETLLGFDLENKKTYVRMSRLQVINKQDPSCNMVLKNLSMRCQGTSSMEYPIKNFRFYTQKDSEDKTYNPMPGTVGNVYTTEMWVGGEDPENDGQQLFGDDRLYAFKGLSDSEKSQPVNCWCLKADYAESSSTHNTGVARLWNQAMRDLTIEYQQIDSRYYLKPHTGTATDKINVCQTIAQKKAIENNYEYDVRTTVDGFPITVFYHTHENDPLRFVGRYNWNNDKSTESVFGFKNIPGFDIDLEPGDIDYGPTMECWEVINGDMPVNTFVNLSNWDESTGGWRDSFESRYPDDHNDPSEARRARKEGTLAPDDPGGALWRVCKWINSTMGASRVENGKMVPNDIPLMNNFKTFKWDYLDVYKIAAYYCYLMRFGAVDQVVKNAMFTTEDGYHWYYINYDNDTINGVDNSGKLRFGYDIDRQTLDPSGSGYCYAGHDSVLWNNLEADDEFMEIVKIIDNALYDTGILTYSRVIDMFNIKQSAAWAERTHNEDYKYKYLDYLSQLEKLQGPRKSHRQWWLSNRFARMDAINGVGSYKNNFISIKPVNNQPVLVNDSVTITSAVEGQIFGYAMGRSMIETDVTAPVGDDIRFIIPVGYTYNVGDLLKFYNPVFMGKFDMSNISRIAGEIQFDAVNSDSFDSTLTEIILGDEYSEGNNYDRLILTGLNNVKYLEKFVMRHYNEITRIDLSGNQYLKYVDLRNCPKLETITLPTAAPIDTLYYPSGNIKNINLNNLVYLDTFGLDSYATIESINISGCPNLTDTNSKSMIFTWLSQKSTADEHCSLYLDNVNWTSVTDAEIERIIAFVDNGGSLTLLGKIKLQNRITSSALAHKLESIFGGTNVWDSRSEFYIDVDPTLIIEGDSTILEGDSYTYTTYYIGHQDYAPTGAPNWTFDTPYSQLRAGTTLNASTGELITTENAAPSDSVIIRCTRASAGLGQSINGTKEIYIRKRVYPKNDLSDVEIVGNNNVIQGTNGYTLRFASNITGAMTATWSMTGALADWVTLTPQGPDGIDGCIVTMENIPDGIPHEDYLVVPGGLHATLRYKNGTAGHEPGSIVGDNGIKSITIGYKDPSIALSSVTNPAAMTAIQQIPLYSTSTYLTNDEASAIYETQLQPGQVAATSIFYTTSVFKLQCKTFNEFSKFAGLYYIPTYLFYECTGLEEITLPDYITEIKPYAFAFCTNLKRIVIPRNVTTVNNYAFYNCRSLEEVEFQKGSSLTTLGQSVFEGCNNLTSVVIPDDVQLTTIPNRAFHSCTRLSSFIIPDNVTNINDYAFYNCSSLVDVTFGESLKTIGEYAFYNTGLISLNITNDAKIINNYAFANCTSLVDVRIGDSVTSIGYDVFYNCSNLESLYIGDNVTTIQQGICNGCPKLKTLHLGAKVSSMYNGYGGALYSDGYVNGFGAKSYVNISSCGKTYRGSNYGYNSYYSSWPFYGCVNLENITIDEQNTVFYDGRSAGGHDCILRKSGNILIAACKNTVIPSDCRTIGGGAFANIPVINVNIPASVTNIYQMAFADCTSLENIYFASNSILTGISGGAFANCKKLRSFIMPDLVGAVSEYSFADCLQMSTFTINNSITSIGQYAFTGDVNLTVLNVPNTVTSLGEGAFYKCENIETFNISSNSQFNVVPDNAFFNCKSMTTLIVPDTVTSIGSSACVGCINLHELYIGKNVASIANTAFRSYNNNCLDLNTIQVDVENSMYNDGRYYGGNNCIIYNQDHSIILGCKNTHWPTNVQSIASYAFAYVPGLYTLTIPDEISIGTIGAYAFTGTGVQTIKLGRLVSTLLDNAFNGCNSLIKVDLGEATTSIGNNTFSNCSMMSEVAIRNPWPPTIGSSIFSNTALAIIWVPSEAAYTRYVGATAWSSYQNKFRYPIPNDF